MINIHDTHTLMGVVARLPAVKTFWLSLCFPTVKTFDTEFIDFDLITRGRRMAPFVAPTAQGKPMLQEGYETRRFKPAYVKPKDAVDPRRVLKRRAGESYTGDMSPQQRHDAIVADILAEHKDMHIRRQEWMAAKAVITGEVTVKGENYPEVLVQFGRKASHTVVLAGAARWGQSGVSIINLIESWMKTVREDSGYNPTKLILGSDAWEVFRKDAEVKENLDTQVRGSQGSLNLGLGDGETIQYKGTLGASLEVWVYSEIVDGDDGTPEALLDAKDAILVAPAGVEGVRCFGAIMDPRAGYVATEFYPKNFIQDDPAAEFVMTQSAPLMVPMRPDAVLRATVV